jgi:T4 RnlA family RNA ligase
MDEATHIKQEKIDSEISVEIEPDKVEGSGLFPQDITLEQLREAIHGREDFREVKGEDYSTFIYFLGMAKDIFPDPATAPDAHTAHLWKLRRECRGIAFSTETGKIIGRRFHKFFNVNETDETAAEKINLEKNFIVLEKLDGSMVSPFYSQGKLRFATKNGITDTTKIVEEFIASRPTIDYRGYSARWIARGWSPIYEWCSQRTRIVLDYPEDSLTLTAIRHMRTGDYLPWNQMQEDAERNGIPVVKARNLAELGLEEWSKGSEEEKGAVKVGVKKFQEFHLLIRERNVGLEGFVIRLENGLMYKIKTRWYCEINRTLDLVSSVRSSHGSEMDCWRVILEEKYDDLRTWLSEGDRKAMDHFGQDLISEIAKTARKMFDYAYNAKFRLALDKKTFAKVVNSEFKDSPMERGLIFKIFDRITLEETEKINESNNNKGKEKENENEKDNDNDSENGKEKENVKTEKEGTENEKEENIENSQIMLIRQDIAETILKNCNKRPLFEKARALAGNLQYSKYLEMYRSTQPFVDRRHLDE